MATPKNSARVAGSRMARMVARRASVRNMNTRLPASMTTDWTIISSPMRTNRRRVLTSEFRRTMSWPVRKRSMLAKEKSITLRYRSLRTS